MANLDDFAEQLMKYVRDRAISSLDQTLSAAVVGPVGDRWRTVLSASDPRAALRDLVPDIVDEVLFQLVNAIDNGELPLAWRDSKGDVTPLDELGMGEMGGWMMGSGWRDRFSTQRFHDYNAGLVLKIDWDESDQPGA